jgi:Matrixin.
MTSRLCSLAGALYLCALPLCLSAQEADPPPAAGAAPTPSVRTLPTPMIRPYDKVITKDAKSDHGVFSVHKLSGKVYYEIPKSQLGREFLWVSQISRTTPGVGYGGQTVGNRVVRWERSENRVLLRDVSHEVVADAALPIARAVEAANNATIIMAFNIEALGKGEAPVIEVTRLFTTEVPEFSARNRLRARGFDGSRSFVERVKSFPENIEVEASQTYTSPPDVPGLSTGAPSPTSVFFGGMKPGSATVVMHYSMVKLPENPMTPRIADSRVGYFSISQTNYGIEEHRAPKRVYITRWRLEKKDPSAELSEPVKPIVFYIDPATPAKWVPYMKRGVEVWQKAFEGAGFKNAILAKDAPSPLEDPEWSPEDARYSVIRWLPSTIENASGPHVSDPRTGEILTSDIQFYHNVMNLVRDWYFVQVAHLDPRAQKLPMPDDLMGELIQQVCTHEVGHTLGLQHNMKASSMYPAEKVHDREWVRKMGHSPSIMDYARFNYVAQPEDKIDLKDLIPRIGPYDEFAILWGYKPIAGADPEKHKPTLDQWARKQDEVPWLRFSTAKANGADPGEQAEAVGDADAVKSTALGMKNLARIADLLIPATATRGENYDELEELYVRLLAQWTREMNHVASIVGGYNSQEKHVGQEGLRFLPIAKERQSEAVRFLNENAFKTPEFAIRREILRRIEPSGVLARLKTYQQLVLNNLLDPARFTRLIEQEAMDGAKSYRPGHFLSDLRKGIWSELGAGQVNVDAYRRSLQHAYLQVLSEKINGRSATEEQRPYLRGELRDLQTEIARAVPRAADRATRLHLEDARDQIAKALDPKFAAPVDFRIPLVVRSSGLELDCWRDYEAELRQ